MLNGEWGNGKTYFVKNGLKQLIESTSLPGQSDLKYKVIYVSLHGVRSINEISTRLALSFYQLQHSRGFKAIGGILNAASGLFNVNLEKIDLSSLMEFSNAFIVFDDLERVSSSVLVADVLGYINSEFVEHNYVKCLIVCDESRIGKNKGQYDTSDYGIIKEKIIYQTFKLESLDNSIKGKVIASIIESDEIFSSDLNDLIIEIIGLAKEDNLRTIKFSLHLLSVALRAFKIHFQNEFDSYKRCIVNNTISLSIEYKRGELPEDFVNYGGLDNETVIFFQRLPPIESVNEETSVTEGANQHSFVHKYYKKYELDDRKDYVFLKYVYYLIINGVVSEQLLEDDHSKMRNRLGNELLSNAEKHYNNLINFRTTSDNDFDTAYRNVLGAVVKGEYEIQRYPSLRQLYLYFEEIGVSKSDEVDVDQSFHIGLQIKLAESIDYDRQILFDLSAASQSASHEAVKSIYESVINAFQYKRDILLKELSNQTLIEIKANKIDEVKMKITSESFPLYLNHWNAEEFANSFVDTSNLFKHEFIEHLSRVYSFQPRILLDEQPQAFEFLKSLRIEFEKIVQSAPGNSISSYHMRRFLRLLDKFK